MSLKLAGPYQSNGKDQLPSADLAVQIMGAAPGTINGRLISTGKNAFVEYGGETYEVGEDVVAQMQKSGDSSGQLTPNDIKTMMGQMQDWFPRPTRRRTPTSTARPSRASPASSTSRPR